MEFQKVGDDPIINNTEQKSIIWEFKGQGELIFSILRLRRLRKLMIGY